MNAFAYLVRFVCALVCVCAVSAESVVSTTDKLLPSDTCSALPPDIQDLLDDMNFHREVNEILLLALKHHGTAYLILVTVCLILPCVVLVLRIFRKQDAARILDLQAENEDLQAQNKNLSAWSLHWEQRHHDKKLEVHQLQQRIDLLIQKWSDWSPDDDCNSAKKHEAVRSFNDREKDKLNGELDLLLRSRLVSRRKELNRDETDSEDDEEPDKEHAAAATAPSQEEPPQKKTDRRWDVVKPSGRRERVTVPLGMFTNK